MKAITPQEASKSRVCSIPDAVFKVFNDMIVANFDDREASFCQEEVVKVLVKKGYKRNEIYENNWLDVEPFYRKAGWKVEYDKPGYNETYPATFTFRAKNASTSL